MRRARVRVSDHEELTRLARAAHGNDARALDALLTAVRPAFARFFSRRLSRDAAEDVTQAALIEMAHLVGRMQPERVRQHMSTIAHTLLATEGERRRREKRESQKIELAERVEWPVDLALRAEHDELVRAVGRAAMLALPVDLQPLVPAMLGERTVVEVAAETGLDAATIRRELSRIRLILQRELRRYA